jgi:hypothetical protein
MTSFTTNMISTTQNLSTCWVARKNTIFSFHFSLHCHIPT